MQRQNMIEKEIREIFHAVFDMGSTRRMYCILNCSEQKYFKTFETSWMFDVAYFARIHSLTARIHYTVSSADIWFRLNTQSLLLIIDSHWICSWILQLFLLILYLCEWYLFDSIKTVCRIFYVHVLCVIQDINVK